MIEDVAFWHHADMNWRRLRLRWQCLLA